LKHPDFRIFAANFKQRVLSMLTRRHIRIKILQNIYALEVSHEYDMQTAENKLIKSAESLYDLYIYQLSFIRKIAEFAEQKIEEGRKKRLPSPEDLNPNMRFVENTFLHALVENPALTREISRLKISWGNYPEIVRNVYAAFTESEEYQQYMAAEDHSFGQDKKITSTLYFNHILASESFEMLFDDMTAGWSDDIAVAAFFIQKTFRAIKNAQPFNQLPALFKTDKNDEEGDYRFMIDLQRKILLHDNEYQQTISAHTRNWDYDRIPHTDVIILKMALAELQNFPTIPIKVTLNEYIELAKMFSPPKSSLFVNGILDKLILKLTEEGKIKKIGRGLIT
jgi:N utilization substance protein B